MLLTAVNEQDGSTYKVELPATQMSVLEGADHHRSKVTMADGAVFVVVENPAYIKERIGGDL